MDQYSLFHLRRSPRHSKPGPPHMVKKTLPTVLLAPVALLTLAVTPAARGDDGLGPEAREPGQIAEEDRTGARQRLGLCQVATGQKLPRRGWQQHIGR